VNQRQLAVGVGGTHRGVEDHLATLRHLHNCAVIKPAGDLGLDDFLQLCEAGLIHR
jgi:transketolase C-terminal domain/subunit